MTKKNQHLKFQKENEIGDKKYLNIKKKCGSD